VNNPTLKDLNMRRALPFSLLLLTCSASNLLAEKNVSLETKLAAVSSPQVSESFDKAIAEPMIGVKGEWTVTDGTLVGKELASDQHAAVLSFQKKNRDSVVRFSFKADGNTKGFNFSLNHAKGHLFRVVITPASISINLDKDKKDPESKAVVLATAKGKIENGEWHTLQVEMVGDCVRAQTDGGLKVEASHPKLNTEKPNYRFVMSGDSLSIDDLQIWEIESAN